MLALASQPGLLRDPWVVACLALAGPLYEEMVFRGVLLRWLLAVVPAGVAVAPMAAHAGRSRAMKRWRTPRKSSSS